MLAPLTRDPVASDFVLFYVKTSRRLVERCFDRNPHLGSSWAHQANVAEQTYLQVISSTSGPREHYRVLVAMQCCSRPSPNRNLDVGSRITVTTSFISNHGAIQNVVGALTLLSEDRVIGAFL